MKTLICLLLYIAAAGCNCNHTISVPSDAYQCLYTVDYAGNGCTKHVFISCQVSRNNHSESYNKQSSCAQYCCKNYTPFCPQEASGQTTAISIPLIVSALSALILLGITVVCIYKFNSYCVACCEDSNCFGKNKVTNVMQMNANETQFHIDSDQQDWKRDGGIQNGECSVCLCQGNNLMLDCGHTFHSQCILQCLKRKYQCVLCRSKDLHIFRLYCLNCKVSYQEIHSLQFFREGRLTTDCLACMTLTKMQEE